MFQYEKTLLNLLSIPLSPRLTSYLCSYNSQTQQKHLIIKLKHAINTIFFVEDLKIFLYSFAEMLNI